MSPVSRLTGLYEETFIKCFVWFLDYYSRILL